MNDNFYRALEDRYRGSRELIKSRLLVYLPFVLPLRARNLRTCAIDFGCGRGEWLELLQEHGFDIQGVDIDDAMLAACRERGLRVHTRDALEFMKELPHDSQMVVSGFHIVEHIPFSEIQALVQESMRVLKPGGILILETPNPENLVVGSSNFYLDPTHQRPLPPNLLAFLPEYAGFERIKVLRLQEAPELAQNPAPSLLDVLNGVSPDYAVVAQKSGPVEVFDAIKPAFEKEYGLTLEALANEYQHRAEMVTEEVRTIGNAQVESMTTMLKVSEADRAARGAQIETLTMMLKESEADRRARGEQIGLLTAMLKGSEADRAARGAQIETLTTMLKESEADRSARGAQIEILTTMLQEAKADIAACGKQSD